MVGFNPNHAVQLSYEEYVAAGGISGCAARVVGQPFDVLKIRFQLQIEPISPSHTSKYHGLIQGCSKIIQEEGFRALWKGHVAAQGLSVTYAISEFVMFEWMTKSLGTRFPQLTSSSLLPVNHFICGGLASSLTTALVMPIDILRTRFVAQGEPKVYTSIISAAMSIYTKEGYWAFYRGVVPALMLVTPQMALQFGLYNMCTSLWNIIYDSTSHRPGALCSFVCGSGSGAVSKLMIYPLDLIKKRLQVQGFEEARRPFGAVTPFYGLTDCLVKTAQEEGVRGLFKGLTPSLLKAAIVSGVHFSVYEQVCNLFASRKQ